MEGRRPPGDRGRSGGERGTLGRKRNAWTGLNRHGASRGRGRLQPRCSGGDGRRAAGSCSDRSADAAGARVGGRTSRGSNIRAARRKRATRTHAVRPRATVRSLLECGARTRPATARSDGLCRGRHRAGRGAATSSPNRQAPATWWDGRALRILAHDQDDRLPGAVKIASAEGGPAGRPRLEALSPDRAAGLARPVIAL